ncbi:hypothetical protein OIU76_020265 [Salix suchowensis]|nr:hypothetical protein OIU76_020265 [Salix suchowensis]
MVWGLCIFCSLIMLSIRSNFGSCLHVEGYDFVVWGLATLKELRAGNAADGAGAGGVTFSVAGQKHYQRNCWGLQRESSRHLHTIGLPDFILKLRCFQTPVTCYQHLPQLASCASGNFVQKSHPIGYFAKAE